MNCLTCGNETSNPKFCSRSCAAKTTNKTNPKRQKEGKCSTCEKIINRPNKYCEECFEKYLFTRANFSTCSICGKLKTIKNTRTYKSNIKGRYQAYCNDCVSGVHRLYNQEMKQKAIDYKGGCCKNCGYNQCAAALEFHHRDPSQKDYNISNATNRPFNDEVKLELDKCDLLCSNCHRQEHKQQKDKEFEQFNTIYRQYQESKCPLSESNGDSA